MKVYLFVLYFLMMLVACNQQSNTPSESSKNSNVEDNLHEVESVTISHAEMEEEHDFDENAEPYREETVDDQKLHVTYSPDDSLWLEHYNDRKANYKNTIEEDIQAIENADDELVDLADFKSSDAKLFDVRGDVSHMVVYRVETDSLYNYKELDFESIKEQAFSYITQYCFFETWVPYKSISFDRNGEAIYMPLVDRENAQVTWIAKRNDDRQLLFFDLDENYMGDADITFWYGEDGMLDSMNYYGMIGKLTTYNYNKSHDLESSHSKWLGSSETEGEDHAVYQILKRDHFGNWIKRYINTTIEDRSEGGYHFSRKYEIEYRKIQYTTNK